jgi:hypothetical protein
MLKHPPQRKQRAVNGQRTVLLLGTTCLGLLSILLTPLIGHACEGTCDALFNGCMQNSNPNTGCQAELDRCLRSCQSGGRSTPPLAPTQLWGFLVFDTSTGRWGRSYGYSSGMEARGAARAACFRDGGVKCDWQIPARDGCVAVAEGEGGSGRMAHQKSGGREALSVAQNKAISNCKREGGRNCRVVAQTCSWGK